MTAHIVAVKCIEEASYERHMQRHAGRLNEDPVKEVACMTYIADKGGLPHVLALEGVYADDHTVFCVLQGRTRVIVESLTVPGMFDMISEQKRVLDEANAPSHCL